MLPFCCSLVCCIFLIPHGHYHSSICLSVSDLLKLSVIWRMLYYWVWRWVQALLGSHWWGGVWFVNTQHGWKFPFLDLLFLTLLEACHCGVVPCFYCYFQVGGFFCSKSEIWSRKQPRKLTAVSILGLWNCYWSLVSTFPSFLCLFHMQWPVRVFVVVSF